MQRSLFYYDLPPELIAQAPLEDRSASRLLTLDGSTGAINDRRFTDLPDLLEPGDLLIFNDTRVLPARLFGRKATGGRVELLLERIIDERRALFQLRASKSPAPGSEVVLDDGTRARVRARRDGFYEIDFDTPLAPHLEAQGDIPLPPYIERSADSSDRERYQTVYARHPGAVAAPTAGLHFDENLMKALVACGIEHAFLTLHVGAGTFSPVRTEQIEAHRLHAERYDISTELCAAVAAAGARGGRVIAVGTTSARALESAACSSGPDSSAPPIEPGSGETELFIYPGFEFRVVDGLVTNFHLPESSLLMLVAAFAGRDATLAAYAHAVEERYRFFSYGDAMLVWPERSAA